MYMDFPFRRFGVAIRQMISLVVIVLPSVLAAQPPKREFRGAWLHTVYQDGYLKRSTEQNKAFLRDQLDKLRQAGVNVVIFQVRPQSDAFYASDLEPWSRFLTNDGKAPAPYWDPLSFIIDEAHSRGMELHAWLNPYRVTSSKKQTLPGKHIYHRHPERFVTYDGKIYFDPGLPENRAYIEEVVADIIRRYDVDGIHFDDYFYPYPVKGKKFPDGKSFKKYGSGMKLGDWRRHNVDLLIEEIHTLIAAEKPWVRFGVSPFGIWRNKASDLRGSDTGGLQNYDDLYADVMLWAEKGWVDYLMPQLYWPLDHKLASYRVLVEWWGANAADRHIYIGQDVARTMSEDELATKIGMTRCRDGIRGVCWWPGYSLTANEGGIADALAGNHQSTIAIPPSYPWINDCRPQYLTDVSLRGDILSWTAPAQRGDVSDAVRFVVYHFFDYDTFDTENSVNIIAVTPETEIEVNEKGIYVVTVLDRVNNESLPSNHVFKK